MANISWREYLFYLIALKKDTVAYGDALPDTLVWNSPNNNDPLSEYYLTHPGFNNYPVVGISYEQAVAFCKWRTYAANQGIYFRENKIKDIQSHLTATFPIHFYYRLPSRKEWEQIAAAGIDSTSKAFKKFHRKSDFAYHTKEVGDAWISSGRSHWSAESGYQPVPANSFYISKAGTYNMIGNVAEMISEKGIAKGGSFNHPLDSCKINIDQHYSQPGRWLGFRCVAVLIK